MLSLVAMIETSCDGCSAVFLEKRLCDDFLCVVNSNEQ